MYQVRYYSTTRRQWMVTQPVATLREACEDKAQLIASGVKRCKVVAVKK